ncbi:DUF6000 family protein [Actinomadura sediminis]|uniref:DUF6000 family protein n=1 Tax=Actinomadura sediminis TaxID=1038904 RepID=A0ABW3EXG4_9ACTN
MTSSLPDYPRELVRHYVIANPRPGVGRYLDLLHGNFTGLSDHERSRFLQDLRRDARQITNDELEFLLHSGELAGWRERLTAAWLIGISRRVQFRESLARLLMDSELTYAGQGYCFALARFAEPKDADVLTAYLDHYLPRTDCHYDQHWAIGALLHVDDRLGTDHSGRFLKADGLWSRSAFGKFDPHEYGRRMAEVCGYVERLDPLDA